MTKHLGLVLTGLLAVAAFAAPGAGQTPATGVTVYEGARLIVGDGSVPIEDSAILVANNKFTEVGRRGQVKVPANAARVSLTGKTIIPAIIDTHTHPPARATRWSTSCGAWRIRIAATLSLGQDAGDLPFQVRGDDSQRRQVLHGRTRITMPEPPHHIPY
jgi:hypothetical protein